ncbi:MAG: GNAT family N-acetyltransferase [Sedimentisphaerales bacterium]|nr:GNAT family N-acetyltransferase [Sedimentisphaerales bacterium]
MEYEIVWFTSGQRREYERFIAGFPGKSYCSETFIGPNWWEPGNPLGGFLLFAYTPDKIASRCVLTGRRLAYEGKPIDCFEIGGTYTLEQHQRKGLFSRLVKQAMRLGLDTPAQVIYGTPNDRSGPGYRKLGYHFIDRPNSRLVLLAHSIHPLLRKLGLKKAPVSRIERPSRQVRCRKWTFTEVSLDEYAAATGPFPRMNWAGDGYLKRRLGTGGDASRRRFFHASSADEQAWYALDDYTLSFLRLILVSEFFLNGQVDFGPTKLRVLRRIASAYYRHHDGIYLKCRVDPEVGTIARVLKHGAFVHRQLPICYYANPRVSSRDIDRMMQKLVEVFQLTDCDIG